MKKKTQKTILACSLCMDRNYSTVKSQTNLTTRLALKKYCPRCSAHTEHRETR